MDLVTEKPLSIKHYFNLAAVSSAIISDMMDKHNVDSLFNLPNRTPNGKINADYPVMDHAVKMILSPLLEGYDYIEKDYNLRIKGQDTEEENNRPYSTHKWHTDIWTGEPENSIGIIIPILGDFQNAGLDFGYTDFMPLKEFSTYEEGFNECVNLHLIKQDMAIGNAYLLLGSCLHKTKPCMDGIRLSLDIRVTKGQPASSSRSGKYIPVKEWLNGNSK